MGRKIPSVFRLSFLFLLGLLISLNITPVWATATQPEVNWIVGSKTITLGDNLAKLNLPKGYIFANAEDTRKLMVYSGNIASQQDIGLVVPEDDLNRWMVTFSYNPIGYVEDDESQAIDNDALLESIRQLTEADNQERQKQGSSPLKIIGWHEEPYYDQTTYNLVWAIAATADEKPVVNYNTRKLGRNGVTSITLITKPENLSKAKPEVEKLVANYSYVPGQQYADFNPATDKTAGISLTALIAGGTGAAATKTGVLAKILLFFGVAFKKLWLLVILGIVALFKPLMGSKK